MELDEIVSDLVTALDKIPLNDGNVVIGGDFNIHDGSDDFLEIRSTLELYNCVLLSDPSQLTFIGHQGSSTPDHIFGSSSLRDQASYYVPTRSDSSHLPLQITVPFPCSVQTDEPALTLNIEVCADRLRNLNPAPPHDLVYSLQQIFDASLEASKRKSSDNSFSSPKLIRLKRDADEALEYFQRNSSNESRTRYVDCRNKVQKHLRSVLSDRRCKKIADVLQAANEHGVKGLYKHAKKFSPPSSSCVPLDQWLNHCSELYQSHPPSTVTAIPSASSEAAQLLMENFTVEEVFQCIRKQKSKAKALSNVSPADLKGLAPPLAKWLTPIFNEILCGNMEFPSIWLDTVFFFLHKKGPVADPSNYRSLAIENPFLKIFTSLIHHRLSNFAESSSLLPDFQFGFRSGHSTTSAILLLQNAINKSLSAKQKVFSCFVDFKKAFDLVNRTKLFEKLQFFGIPFKLCSLLNTVMGNISLRVRSNGSVSSTFVSHNGLPQGDPLSPLLFSLYIADLPDVLHCCNGIPLQSNTHDSLKYILYADDLVLVAPTPIDLQISVARLQTYCTENDLTVSIPKTKCLAFYKGNIPYYSIFLNGEKLDKVNEFTYLGVVLTTRLASSKHISRVLSQCNSRMGFLFAKLHLQDIPVSVALTVFRTYILPILSYALPTWLPKARASSITKINALFTKFLKRFLCVPYATPNVLVHSTLKTSPLIHQLDTIHASMFQNLSFPTAMEGIRFTPPPDCPRPLSAPMTLPEYMSLSPVAIPPDLPIKGTAKRALLYDAFDLFHPHMCTDSSFHTKVDPDTCTCKFCDAAMDYFHRFACPNLTGLSPCQVLKKVIRP
jgi:hypothetical protein